MQDVLNMPFFARNIIGVGLLVSLFLMAGCTPTQSINRTAKTSIFPWQKTEKEPERAGNASLDDILARPRVTTLVTR
jgi:hypothetical protein